MIYDTSKVEEAQAATEYFDKLAEKEKYDIIFSDIKIKFDLVSDQVNHPKFTQNSPKVQRVNDQSNE